MKASKNVFLFFLFSIFPLHASFEVPVQNINGSNFESTLITGPTLTFPKTNGLRIVRDRTVTTRLHATFLEETGGGVYNIWYSRSDNNGASWTPTLIKSTNISASSPVIDVSSGTAFIAFSDGSNGLYQLYLAKGVIGAGSTAFAPAINLTPTMAGFVQRDQIWDIFLLFDTNTNQLHLAWKGYDAIAGSSYGIYYARSTDLGASWSAQAAVNDANLNYNPLIAKSPNGNFMALMWTAFNNTFTHASIEYVTLGGGSFTPGVQTYNDSGFPTYFPSATYDNAGNLHMAYIVETTGLLLGYGLVRYVKNFASPVSIEGTNINTAPVIGYTSLSQVPFVIWNNSARSMMQASQLSSSSFSTPLQINTTVGNTYFPHTVPLISNDITDLLFYSTQAPNSVYYHQTNDIIAPQQPTFNAITLGPNTCDLAAAPFVTVTGSLPPGASSVELTLNGFAGPVVVNTNPYTYTFSNVSRGVAYTLSAVSVDSMGNRNNTLPPIAVGSVAAINPACALSGVTWNITYQGAVCSLTTNALLTVTVTNPYPNNANQMRFDLTGSSFVGVSSSVLTLPQTQKIYAPLSRAGAYFLTVSAFNTGTGQSVVGSAQSITIPQIPAVCAFFDITRPPTGNNSAVGNAGICNAISVEWNDFDPNKNAPIAFYFSTNSTGTAGICTPNATLPEMPNSALEDDPANSLLLQAGNTSCGGLPIGQSFYVCGYMYSSYGALKDCSSQPFFNDCAANTIPQIAILSQTQLSSTDIQAQFSYMDGDIVAVPNDYSPLSVSFYLDADRNLNTSPSYLINSSPISISDVLPAPNSGTYTTGVLTPTAGSIPTGIYYLCARITDPLGASSFDCYSTTVNYVDPLSNSFGQQIYSMPNPFSPLTNYYPSEPGFDGTTRIVFNITSAIPGASLSVFIFDTHGRIVYRTTVPTMTAYPNFRWDGRSTNGDILPNGVYLIRAQLSSNRQVLKGRLTILDKMP